MTSPPKIAWQAKKHPAGRESPGNLDALPESQQVMLKLSIPATAGLYTPLRPGTLPKVLARRRAVGRVFDR